MAEPNLSSVRALIFDLDGTLIDSKKDLIHSVNAMLRELGRQELAEETISGYIGHGAPRLVARALGESCSEEERQRALEFFLRYYETHKIDTTQRVSGGSGNAGKTAGYAHGGFDEQAGADQRADLGCDGALEIFSSDLWWQQF